MSQIAGPVIQFHFAANENLYFSQTGGTFLFSFANDADTANVGSVQMSCANTFEFDMVSPNRTLLIDTSAGTLRLNIVNNGNSANEPLEIRSSATSVTQGNFSVPANNIDANSYSCQTTPGFNGTVTPVTSITVKNGIVTAVA
jgi:hypothetical protein